MASLGNVQSFGNVISWLTGSNNVGTVANSVFVKLNAADSFLNVMNSVYCKFDIKNTGLNASNNVNTEVKGEKGDLYLENNFSLKITGDSNKGVFQNNAYSKLEGDRNECTFQENVNLQYFGDNGKCFFSHNKKAKLFGNNNEVFASNNANLKVEGANHLLSISGTANHVVKTLPEISSEHALRIVPPNGANQTGFLGGIMSNICSYFSKYGSGTTTTSISTNGIARTYNYIDINGAVSVTSSTTTGNNGNGVTTISIGNNRIGNGVTTTSIGNNSTGNGVTYYIDYVKEASINSSEYNLGIFNFNIVEKDKQARLTFDKSRFDSGSFGVINRSAGQYTVTGTKDGKTQTISIIGPFIVLSATNELIVTW